MTGSGCSVTPPTYGYNDFGSGYGSTDGVKAISITTSIISLIASFVGLSTYTIKSIVSGIVTKLYKDAKISSLSASFEGKIFYDFSSATHAAIYGAVHKRNRTRIDPTKWSSYSSISSWYHSTFWSVKPCYVLVLECF